MTIDVQFEFQPNYMKLICKGIFDGDALIEAYEHAFTLAASKGYGAFLADIRDVTGGPPSTMDRYDGGVQFAMLQREVGQGIAVAFVGNVPLVDPERFAEVVAANRGAFARVFTDHDEAVDWLENEARTGTSGRGWR